MYAYAQRIPDAIKLEDEALGDSSSFVPAASSPTSDKGEPSQEVILQTIIDYVHLDASSDHSCRPVAPLLFMHAGAGTGKSWIAREILKRFCGQCGNNVVKYMAPSGIAASNLNDGSTCHHGMGLKVHNANEVRANVDKKGATSDRSRRFFLGCKVLVVDEVSMVCCGMLREID